MRISSASVVYKPLLRKEYRVKSANSCSSSRACSWSVRICWEIVFNALYNMGFVLGVKVFTAAVLGGIGNVRGAVVGGLVFGLVENYGGYIIQASYKDVIVFGVLVLVLLVRSSGLLGERLGRAA